MKISLLSVLAGLGGIGTVGTAIGITYHGSEVEKFRDFDIKFQELREEIQKFADVCRGKEGNTDKREVLKDLEDIFKILLGLQEKDNSNLNSKKESLKNYLEEEKWESFEEIIKKMEEFSKSLENNSAKFAKYKEQLK